MARGPETQFCFPRLFSLSLAPPRPQRHEERGGPSVTLGYSVRYLSLSSLLGMVSLRRGGWAAFCTFQRGSSPLSTGRGQRRRLSARYRRGRPARAARTHIPSEGELRPGAGVRAGGGLPTFLPDVGRGRGPRPPATSLSACEELART